MITKSTKLPSRKVLKELGTSKMTINDYAKVTPVKPEESVAPLFQLLRAEQINRR
jgi:hypothetical protein